MVKKNSDHIDGRTVLNAWKHEHKTEKYAFTETDLSFMLCVTPVTHQILYLTIQKQLCFNFVFGRIKD